MIAPEKVQLLQKFLGSLPGPAAARLAKAVEVDRLVDGKALPHDLILDGLRPKLQQAGPLARTITPLRLFCRPFEDMLCIGARSGKQKGMIGRGAIAPVWHWLGESLMPEALAAYTASVKAAVLEHRADDAQACAVEFWPAASAVIFEALASETGAKTARRILGGDTIVADAHEIAVVLAAAPEILEIQAALPKPVPDLDEDLLWPLREIYNRIVERVPDAAPYVAVITMRRLERPWEALKLPLFVSRQTQETLISSTDMGLVGEIIFCEIEAHTASIRSVRHPDVDASMVIGHLAEFSKLSMGIVREVEMRRDGKWGQRLLKARSAVSDAMESLLERAPREVLAAFPTQRAGFKGGPRAADIAHAPNVEKQMRARAYARVVEDAKPYGAAACIGASLKAASDEIVNFLRLYTEEMLSELRTSDGERRANAEGHFAFAVEITGMMTGAKDAELLERRGRAAVAPAAASTAA